MKCLRCGYCCVHSWVMIVNPDKVANDVIMDKESLIFKASGDVCPHLYEDELKDELKYKCTIHHYKWYKETPCFEHGQIEESPEDPCRMGTYLLLPENKEMRMKVLGR